jgi:hypothetical protein
MSKDQNSIIIPTEEELVIYKQFVNDIPDSQIDEYANEYYDLVSSGVTKVSFPRFMIDKIIRPIKEGDTINFETEDKQTIFMFCIVRKNIEGKDYLLFCKVDTETETLYHEEVYLFFVDGKDNIGTEILDIVPSGEEANKILALMEVDLDVAEIKEDILQMEE